MLVQIFSALALVMTVARGWPQFVRIVLKGERAGVSALTWDLAVTSHIGWLMYGVLSDVPLLIVVNSLAGAGCIATTAVLRSKRAAILEVIASVLVSWGAYEIADALLLGLITALSLAMFVPQLVKVRRTSTAGVSLTTWLFASLASASWIGYAFAIHRPTIAIAHFFMLPVAFAICVTALLGRDRRTSGKAP